MKLSAPIHKLRSQAKRLKTERQIPLFQAQNEVAREQGFSSWSLMMSQQDDLLPKNIAELLDYLNVGDIALLGARPRLGKTRLTAGLIAECVKIGRPKSFFFTLVDRSVDAKQRIINHLDGEGLHSSTVVVDSSDEICADHVIDCLKTEAITGALVVIDYLQVLDEKRHLPTLQEQVEALKSFAQTSGCIVVVLSQLDRKVDDRSSQSPGLTDIRLPNPLDTNLFNKIMFLYQKDPGSPERRLQLIRPVPHELAIGLDGPAKQFRDSNARLRLIKRLRRLAWIAKPYILKLS
jgi:replicative DNA helicase